MPQTPLLRATSRVALLVPLETALILCAVAAGVYLRLGEAGLVRFSTSLGVGQALLVAGVCQICFYLSDLYDLRRIGDWRGLFVRMFTALAWASFILAVLYYWFPSLVIGRGVFLIAAGLVIAMVVGWRVMFRWVMQRLGPSERLLLVGTGPGAVKLARELFERREHSGVEIVGFVDPDPSRVGAPVINPGVVGTIEDIPSLVRARGVDRVVVSLEDSRGKLPMDKLLEMKLQGVAFDHLASVYEGYTGKIAVENLRPSWLIFSEGFRKTRVISSVKRVFDVVFALIALVVAVPLMGRIALVVKATSRGPVLYHQSRVGQHGLNNECGMMNDE